MLGGLQVDFLLYIGFSSTLSLLCQLIYILNAPWPLFLEGKLLSIPVLPGDHSCESVKPRFLIGSTRTLVRKRKAGLSIFPTGA
jgi:hypothetical protein